MKKKNISYILLFSFLALLIINTSTISVFAETEDVIIEEEFKDNLVAYWKCDDEKVKLTDESIYGNDGSFKNFDDLDDVYVDGKKEKAINFDGTDNYIEIADDPSLNFTEFTVCLWFKANAIGTYCLISKSTTLTHGWYFFLVNDGGLKVRANIIDSLGYNFITTSTIISLDTWYFTSLVSNGTNAQIYLNAQSEDNINMLSVSNSTDNLLIGANWGDSPDWYYDGIIDDISIFNTALSTSEINLIYEGREIEEEQPEGLTPLALGVYIGLPTALVVGIISYVLVQRNKATTKSGKGTTQKLRGKQKAK